MSRHRERARSHAPREPQQAAGVEAHFSEFVRHARVSDSDVRARLAERRAATCIRSSRTALPASSRIVIRCQARVSACRCRRGRPRCARGIAAARSPQRHRRARDLESHRQGAVRARRGRRATLHSLGARRRVGRGARSRAARVSRARAARDRELDRGRARAARSCGTTAATCASAATRCGRALRLPRRCASGIPRGRAIKLGAAARLYPVKGLAIVLHAVAVLRALRPALDVELAGRGRGAELARLQVVGRAARAWRSTVTFHGAVDDMPAFYSSIDCLLHTPITEAFGLVAIEAAAHGCPVIAAGVDGLAEAVARRRDGPLDRADVAARALRRARRRARRACRSASTIPPPTRCASRAPSIPSAWPRKSPRCSRTRARTRRERRGERARARATELRRPCSRRHGSHRWLHRPLVTAAAGGGAA